MGNGNKFRFSNVLPNVFSKIKGVGPRKISGRTKGSEPSSTAPAEACDHELDQNVHRFGNRKSSADRDRSISPAGRMFTHATTQRTKDARHSLSPGMVGGAHQRTYDIRFPAESPVRNSTGNKSRSHSPPPQCLARAIQNSTAQSDPGCCSFDSSTLALVPHVDGRQQQRRDFSPVFGRCTIMAKCNSFRGSTHSDSEISETDTTSSRAHSRRRLRHSRNRSSHLGSSSRRSTCCELEGCCYDSANHRPWDAKAQKQQQQQQDPGAAASTIRRGSNFKSQQQPRKDQSPKVANRSCSHEQLYGGSSPIHPSGPETRILYNSSNSPATPALTAASYYGIAAAHARDGGRECVGLGGSGGGGGGGARAETPRSRSRERSRSERHHQNQRPRHAQTPPNGTQQLQFKDRGSSRKLSFACAGAGLGAEPESRQHLGDVETSFSSEDEAASRNLYNVARGGSKDCSSNPKASLTSSRSWTAAPNHSDILKPQRIPSYSRVDDENRAEYISREMGLELELELEGGGEYHKDSTKIRQHQIQDGNNGDLSFQRERALAKTVLDASDGWARRQLSKFSQDDDDLYHLGVRSADTEAVPRRNSSAGVPAKVPSKGAQGGKDEKSGGWPEENVLAIVRLNDSKLLPIGSRVVSLAKLRDEHGDQARVLLKKAEGFDEEYPNDDEKCDGQHPIWTFRSPPRASSRDFSSLKSPKTPSPLGEVEKRTEGRIAYKSSSCSPSGNTERGRNVAFSKPKLLSRMFADEELSSRSGSSSADGKSSSGPGDDTKKFQSARMEADVKEIGVPLCDAEYPSFRSDSMFIRAGGGKGREGKDLGGSGRVLPEERVTAAAGAAAQVEFFDIQDSKVPTPPTPRNTERQRQSKIGVAYPDQETPTRSLSGRNSARARSPAPREEVIKAGLKPFRSATTPSKSPSRRSMPELSSNSSNSTRQGRTSSSGSPCSVQDFSSSGRKLPNRSPSPIKDANNTSKRHTNRSPRRLNAQGTWQSVNNSGSGQALASSTPPPSQAPANFGPVAHQPTTTQRSQSPIRDQSPTSRQKRLLSAKAEAGMQRLDSVAVVKASYDPYQDFRESMVEMILENDIRTAGDLEDLLQCYLSLNLSDYHKVIVQVFTDIWGDIFEQ